MQQYLLKNISELAHRRAIIMREEAQLWDILARDLKREAGRLEDAAPRPATRMPLVAPPQESAEPDQPKMLVGIAEAGRMMGISRSKLYQEIADSRLPVRKAGRRTLIAVSDIHDWWDNLTERHTRL